MGIPSLCRVRLLLICWERLLIYVSFNRSSHLKWLKIRKIIIVPQHALKIIASKFTVLQFQSRLAISHSWPQFLA